jgi:hypothetical protein
MDIDDFDELLLLLAYERRQQGQRTYTGQSGHDYIKELLESAHPTVLRVATFDPRYDITWRMSVHQSMRSVPEPSVLCHNLLLARARVRYAPELGVFCFLSALRSIALSLPAAFAAGCVGILSGAPAWHVCLTSRRFD